MKDKLLFAHFWQGTLQMVGAPAHYNCNPTTPNWCNNGLKNHTYHQHPHHHHHRTDGETPALPPIDPKVPHCERGKITSPQCPSVSPVTSPKSPSSCCCCCCCAHTCRHLQVPCHWPLPPLPQPAPSQPDWQVGGGWAADFDQGDLNSLFTNTAGIGYTGAPISAGVNGICLWVNFGVSLFTEYFGGLVSI